MKTYKIVGIYSCCLSEDFPAAGVTADFLRDHMHETESQVHFESMSEYVATRIYRQDYAESMIDDTAYDWQDGYDCTAYEVYNLVECDGNGSEKVLLSTVID